MLRRITHLPPSVIGFRAEGQVTRDDYERILIPLLEDLHTRGVKISFIYQFGPDFTGFTPGAIWDDLKIGIQHMSIFEKLAIVSDIGWVKGSGTLIGAFMPCPTRVFENKELDAAIKWMTPTSQETQLHA